MKKRIIGLLCLTLLISACGVQQKEQSSPEQTVQKQGTQKQNTQNQQGGKNKDSNASQGEVKLDVAQEANQIAFKTKGVQHVSSVAIDKELSLAVDVRQMQRWNLDKIRKEIFHHLRDRFPDLEIHVSTDRKILWELQKLEKDMYASNPDVKSIQKKLMKVNEDMKG